MSNYKDEDLFAKMVSVVGDKLGLSPDELWAHCYNRGLVAKRTAFNSWTRGDTQPRLSEYNAVARALNELLERHRSPHRMPVIQWFTSAQRQRTGRKPAR